MRAICKIIRLRGRKSSATASLSYVYAKGVPVCGHSSVGVFMGRASVDAAIFEESRDAFGEAAEVRHVVFSADEKPSPEVNRILALIAEDWARIWAGGRAWVGVVHSDKGHAHLHLVVANRGSDGRCLPLGAKGHRANEDPRIYGAGAGGGAWLWSFGGDAFRAAPRGH